MILKHISGSHSDVAPFLPLTRAHELLEQYTATDEVVILVDHLWESHLATDVLKPFVAVIKKHRPWKIFLVINSWEQANHKAIEEVGADDILYVDFFLYRVYKEIVVRKKSSTKQADSLPYSRDKFLFLTGKAHRTNRIGLLKKFINANLMGNAEWSFYYFALNKRYNVLVREQLSNLNDAEFEQFINTWRRNPDNINIEKTVTTYGYEYNGIPYDVSLYANTDFSVVSETTFDETINPWITEKVWIPILNKHPFIIAGDTNILNKLEQMGFETFREFLKVSDYDTITDPNARLDAVVANTQHFLTTLKDHAQTVNQDANSNYSKLTDLYFINNEKILNFIYRNNLIEFSIDDIVPTVGRYDSHLDDSTHDQRFVAFYNKIKDTQWPDVTSVSDFYNLPEEIRLECVNTFGFIPPPQ